MAARCLGVRTHVSVSCRIPRDLTDEWTKVLESHRSEYEHLVLIQTGDLGGIHFEQIGQDCIVVFAQQWRFQFPVRFSRRETGR